MSTCYRQTWDIKKIICYLAYRFIARWLPEGEELGPIGTYSQKLRSRLSMPLLKESGIGIGIGRGARFGNGSNLIMKDYSNIGAFAFISGSRALLTIGKHVMMGNSCTIILQNHKFLQEGFDGYVGKDVVIDDFAWIGHNVIILPGVKIGRHAIIGAGAVVTRDVPEYAIAAGNPARVIRSRK